MQKLIDVWDGWLTGGGVFSVLESLEGVTLPWAEDAISAELDAEYYGNVSGDKPCSPLLRKMVEGSTMTTAEKEFAAAVIVSLCLPNWTREWATLSAEYNPIENYSMTEEMTDDETVSDYGRVHTREDNLKNESKTAVYGFNSTDPSDAGTGEITNTGVVTDRDSGSDTHTRNYTLTRSGNIGVTTSQQMLQSERELWMWNFFRDVVFTDVDRVLTIPIY